MLEEEFKSNPGGQGWQLVCELSATPVSQGVQEVCPPKLIVLPSHGTQAAASAVVWRPFSQ